MTYCTSHSCVNMSAMPTAHNLTHYTDRSSQVTTDEMWRFGARMRSKCRYSEELMVGNRTPAYPDNQTHIKKLPILERVWKTMAASVLKCNVCWPEATVLPCIKSLKYEFLTFHRVSNTGQFFCAPRGVADKV